jgi:hypothetical protein
MRYAVIHSRSGRPQLPCPRRTYSNGRSPGGIASDCLLPTDDDVGLINASDSEPPLVWAITVVPPVPTAVNSRSESTPHNRLCPTSAEGSGYPTTWWRGRRPIGEDLVAQSDAAVANENTRPSYEPVHVLFRLPAKGTAVASRPLTTIHTERLLGRAVARLERLSRFQDSCSLVLSGGVLDSHDGQARRIEPPFAKRSENPLHLDLNADRFHCSELRAELPWFEGA